MKIGACTNRSMLGLAALLASVWAGNPPALAATSAMSIECGKAKVGTSVICEPISPALKNEAATTLRLKPDIVQTGAEFRIVDEGCSAGIAPARSCAVVVKFSPAAAGERTAILHSTRSHPATSRLRYIRSR